MDKRKNVVILGAGALGAMYARAFAGTPDLALSFLADPERAQRLRRDGVVVNGEHLMLPVLRPDSDEHHRLRMDADLIVVGLKHHHLSKGIELAEPYVGTDTLVISVMNGIESEDKLGAAFGKEKIVHTVALGMDAVREGNRVYYTKMGRLLIGAGFDETPDDALSRVSKLLDSGEITYEIRSDILRQLWSKFMLNVGINQVSAVLGAPYRQFQAEGPARSLMRKAMLEVVALSYAVGAGLGEKDVEPWFEIIGTLSPEGKTSMLQDVEAHRKTEVEMFAGTVVDLGRKHRVPTPVNEVILDLLQAKELTVQA